MNRGSRGKRSGVSADLLEKLGFLGRSAEILAGLGSWRFGDRCY